MAKTLHALTEESIKRAYKSTDKGIVNSKNISKTDRDRLVKAKWLLPIIKGWHMLCQPSAEGESTAWYASFWDFIAVYLNDRFGTNYCLAYNSSIDVHLGKSVIPKQLLVTTNKGGSSVLHLPFNTSLMLYQDKKAIPDEVETVYDIRVMPLTYALCKAPMSFYHNKSDDAEIALRLINSPERMSKAILTTKNISAAERIIGGYSFLNQHDMAEIIKKNVEAAGYSPKPINPFEIEKPLFNKNQRIMSPYAARINIMWQTLREDVIKIFPKDPGIPKDKEKYFKHNESISHEDAYHSLSIEGYKVSEALLSKIESGDWDPDNVQEDRNQRNALAAKGYLDTFKLVQESIADIFEGKSSGIIFRRDLQTWYSALFSSSVTANIVDAEQLVGYRNNQVYIRGSMHVPLPKNALIDAMETLFDNLREEPEAAVRAVLGHFVFVYIHPYMDGNGRIGRFLMNCMFASGGFPWTIIRVEHRDTYFAALEKSSVDGDIIPLAKFILKQMNNSKKYR